jgi:hypothetical protein
MAAGGRGRVIFQIDNSYRLSKTDERALSSQSYCLCPVIGLAIDIGHVHVPNEGHTLLSIFHQCSFTLLVA